MPRELCIYCHRPLKTCFCDYTVAIDNPHPVIIWQHPSEHNHPKGSAPLLAKSLSQTILINSEIASMEDIAGEAGINLKEGKIYLLFPDEGGFSTKSPNIQSPSISGIIAIDGTWRKARKILHLNPWLTKLPRIAIDSKIKGLYEGFRKAETEGQLSTLEAVCQALEIIEQNPMKYRPLTTEFARYLEHLKSFQPSAC